MEIARNGLLIDLLRDAILVASCEGVETSLMAIDWCSIGQRYLGKLVVCRVKSPL